LCEHGTPGINRPIGVQVAGNSNGNYVERRAPFVEANSVGNTSVAFGLSGGKLTLAPRPFEPRVSKFVVSFRPQKPADRDPWRAPAPTNWQSARRLYLTRLLPTNRCHPAADQMLC